MDIDERFDRLEAMMRSLKDDLLERIQSVGGDLHTQIQETETRLRGDAGMLRGGSIQITRLIEWSEKIDGIIAQPQTEINDLKRRLSERENGQK